MPWPKGLYNSFYFLNFRLGGEKFNVKNKGKKKALSLLLTGVLLFCVVAMVSAPCGAQTPTPTPAEVFPPEAAFGAFISAIGVILAVFVFLVYIGYRADKDLKTGEFRRAVAGLFVVGFSTLAILSFVFNILRALIIPAYIELVGIIIGFYFGQRSVASTAPATTTETEQTEEGETSETEQTEEGET
jgi:hypothetical protein